MFTYRVSTINNLLMGSAVMVLSYGGFKMQQSILAVLAYWWGKVGVVMIGLLPLSFLLLAVVINFVVEPGSRQSEKMKILLKIISFAAPSLGLLGTVLGTVEGTSQFSLANGVTELLDGVSALMHGLSIALLSTAWGSVIGIPAGVLLIVFFEKEQAVSQSILPQSKPVSAVSENSGDELNDVQGDERNYEFKGDSNE